MTRPHFRLEPIVDLVSDETLGFELLAGADRCPDWTDDGWRTWYARMADLFRAHIPASVRIFVNVDAHQALDPVIIEGLLAIPGRDRLVVEWTEHIPPRTPRRGLLRSISVRLCATDASRLCAGN